MSIPLATFLSSSLSGLCDGQTHDHRQSIRKIKSILLVSRSLIYIWRYWTGFDDFSTHDELSVWSKAGSGPDDEDHAWGYPTDFECRWVVRIWIHPSCANAEIKLLISELLWIITMAKIKNRWQIRSLSLARHQTFPWLLDWIQIENGNYGTLS